LPRGRSDPRPVGPTMGRLFDRTFGERPLPSKIRPSPRVRPNPPKVRLAETGRIFQDPQVAVKKMT
jgi:hypothetical protein